MSESFFYNQSQQRQLDFSRRIDQGQFRVDNLYHQQLRPNYSQDYIMNEQVNPLREYKPLYTPMGTHDVRTPLQKNETYEYLDLEKNLNLKLFK